MKLIFIGQLLIMFDINWTVNAAVLDILPDFAGYVLILWGLLGIAAKSGHFESALLPAKLLTAWAGLDFALTLLGSPQTDLAPLRHGYSALALAATALHLYLLYQLTRGMMELESQSGSGEMRTGRLLSAWQYMVLLHVPLLVLSPFASGSSLLSAACLLLMLGLMAASLCYLAYYYTAWKMYEQLSA